MALVTNAAQVAEECGHIFDELMRMANDYSNPRIRAFSERRYGD